MTIDLDHNNLEELIFPDSDKHAVLISFWYGKESDDEFYDMTLALFEFMENCPLGRYDGHEMNMDNTDGTLFFYGQNAESLYKYIKPELLKYDFLHGSEVYLRFGGLKQESLDLEIKLEPTQHRK